jgi:hypothetical protein
MYHTGRLRDCSRRYGKCITSLKTSLTAALPETYKNEKLEVSDWAAHETTTDDNEDDEDEDESDTSDD